MVTRLVFAPRDERMCLCEKAVCWVCEQVVPRRLTSRVVCTDHRVCFHCDDATKRNPGKVIGKAIADPVYAGKLMDKRLRESTG